MSVTDVKALAADFTFPLSVAKAINKPANTKDTKKMAGVMLRAVPEYEAFV